ncbi:MAG TPA: ATP-binding protein [Archangium sp.]|nr:ATP-binding protein [Archangium sp.]
MDHTEAELMPHEEPAQVNDLARDGQGRLWAATVRGLFLVEPGGARRFTSAQGLRGNAVHLFQPFFSTKAHSGTGLELARVARLVSLYGGHIDVQSEPGRGTTFSVFMPHGAASAPTAAG